MTEPEFNAANAAGQVQATTDDGSADEGSVATPVGSTYTLTQFLPLLLALQSTQDFLSSAPTFVPQTFQDQIQFVYDGSSYSLYLYFNNQWNSIMLGGGGIEGLSQNLATPSLGSFAGPLILQFNSNVAANGVTWDPSTFEFVVVTPGLYLVNAVLQWGAAPAIGDVYLYLYLNSSLYMFDTASYPSGQNAGTECTAIMNLAAGDRISAYYRQSTGFSAVTTLQTLGITKV